MEDVSLDYAREHLQELLVRAARGEEIGIVVPDLGTVHLAVSGSKTHLYPPRIVGQWKHLADIPEARLLEPLSGDDLAWLSGELSEAP